MKRPSHRREWYPAGFVPLPEHCQFAVPGRIFMVAPTREPSLNARAPHFLARLLDAVILLVDIRSPMYF